MDTFVWEYALCDSVVDHLLRTLDLYTDPSECYRPPGSGLQKSDPEPSESVYDSNLMPSAEI